MGLGQTILYIVIPVAVVIYLLLGDTTGYNFSLKVNFIANFFAPLLAYMMASSIGIMFIFSEQKNPLFEFILIGIVTFMIVYTIASISMYKAAKDKTIPGTESKETCKNYKMSSAMKHGLKIAIISMITFVIVVMFPMLQKPFVKITKRMGVENPQKIAYGIIGFYMAFMSLTGTSLAYFPALEEGCRMTDSELKDAFDKGYPTLNYLKYRTQIKEHEAPLILDVQKNTPVDKDLGLLRRKCGIDKKDDKKKANVKVTQQKSKGAVSKGIKFIPKVNTIYIAQRTLPLHRSGLDAACGKSNRRVLKSGELFKVKNIDKDPDSFSTLQDRFCNKIGYIKTSYFLKENVKEASNTDLIGVKQTKCDDSKNFIRTSAASDKSECPKCPSIPTQQPKKPTQQPKKPTQTAREIKNKQCIKEGKVIHPVLKICYKPKRLESVRTIP